MRDMLANLKVKLATLQHGYGVETACNIATGSSEIDRVLGGGIGRGALHEVYAAQSSDAASASSFALILALRAAGDRMAVWVRHDYAVSEAGQIHALGLVELGFDPGQLIVVRARSPTDALRAGAEAATCAPLGAVLIELWGNSEVVDLTVSRRLSLAARASGVTLMMIRTGASHAPSAASTRWSVRTAASSSLEANAPGHPAFNLTLLRSRVGVSGHRWIVEWDRDRRAFDEATTMAGGVVSFTGDGPPLATVSAAH